MTFDELLEEYITQTITAIEAIRMLSGIFDPETAVDLLVVINQITRVEQGDLDREDLKESLGI